MRKKKKVEYGYYERERERERERKDKKKSSKLAYLISFTYRFEIWSYLLLFFLIQKVVVRIRDNEREKRDNKTTI